ncbi:phosphate acyltransferase PlsX [Candidatus Villigracilis saccharophilus]|jgi:glycerol-3-phosphate acyltransferase PlsX|uniref:phosphate acyltransferase PlsX n=1 Tax=Candidatus Villigracilis saccharophilus TaxID=3140684 RepID=UPI003136AB1F|nr:phosphate acyltransferase PlsX [Anaerolineales bacterium]
MVRIVVDAMGSDNYPVPDVEGAVQAAREYGVEIILVGDESIIKPVLEKQDTKGLKISVVNAPEMLSMEDKGEKLVLKARSKDAKNSMAVGIDLVKSSGADAFVTAGNTGAGMVTALFRLGRIRGVDRPALAPIFPTATGTCVVLDIGANPDCKPENLFQFGILGSIYAEKVRGVKNPKVGLISNGEEEGKGNELVKGATPLFKASKLNYFGNVEGKEVIGGKVDVAVTDGFTGNVMLKSSEAVAKLITDRIREIIKNGSVATKIGGLLVKPALGAIKKLLDPSEQGAAPLLGINGLVFIGHGRSDAFAIKNAIRVAKHAVDVNVLDAMKSAIEESLKNSA